MSTRTEYQREYQRRRRAADPEKARSEQRLAYQRLKEREAADPSLKLRREAKAQAWRLSHLEEHARRARESYRRIRSTPEGRARLREGQRRASHLYASEIRNRAKLRARWRASRELRGGRLVRQPCEVCGDPRTQMHHDSYLRPLDVRWLCKRDHEAAHHKAWPRPRLVPLVRAHRMLAGRAEA